MKAVKYFGIIAFIAVIGFSMAACDNGATAGLALYTESTGRVTVSLNDTVPAVNVYKN